MTFFGFLETLLIGPLKLIFELIFQIANDFIGNPGLSIVFLSLAMNVLVLPLYKRADAMQEEARDTENRLAPGVSHIKKTFSGDERMMMLQAYYRQNHYKPTDALHGSVSLLLEIPFFMAAYQFLSNLQVLHGVGLGPIRDLSAPDGLLVIGGFSINLLPVLMTLINVVSSAIYLKGFPLKTKIQLYGMAAFFLVFLYTSPSGLVFYWTLNNLFSLVKTIFYKVKNPKKLLNVGMAIAGVALCIFGAFFYTNPSIKKKAAVVALGLILIAPLVYSLIQVRFLKQKPKTEVAKAYTPNRKVFVLGCLFLAVLIGLMIPSSVIASSPQEFVDINDFYHPIWFLVSSFSMAVGLFIIWFGVFYWLASPKAKVVFSYAMWILCGGALINYMVFDVDFGDLNIALQFEKVMIFGVLETVLNLAVLLLAAVLMFFLFKKFSKAVGSVLLIAVLAVSTMSLINVVTVFSQVNQIRTDGTSNKPEIGLSKTGKNVIVMMLDRAMGEYVPYMMAERPELMEQFDGFTYYSNVISHGGYTNMGVPGALGGYEYTPVEMNRRDDVLLKDKHNEALKVMPTLFSESGYDVTVCDPVYAGYQQIPDLTIFDDLENTTAYITKGAFDDPETRQQVRENNHRNFFCYGLMESVPLLFQRVLYCEGSYHLAVETGGKQSIAADGLTAEGVDPEFQPEYNVLTNLSTMTRTDGENSTYTFFYNAAPHEPALLQTPDYVPAETVDNTAYEKENADRFTVDGVTLKMDSKDKITHYHVNMATFIQLGEWFDYLREEGVWDNTRIILVSDHGRHLYHLSPELWMKSGFGDYGNVELFFPLLMVKDFDSTGFTTKKDFMTNADVPALALDGLIEDPVNPFTGKVINSDEKTAHPQYILLSNEYQVTKNNGTTFIPGKWASVEKDLWEKENWIYYGEEVVLKEHAFPQG